MLFVKKWRAWMKAFNIILAGLATLLFFSTNGIAGDFGWMHDLNMRAEADPSAFRARLEARFHVGDMDIEAVLGNVHEPADAYMLLRLGEMSHRPMEHVLETYRSGKGRGWGVLAKSLGIKPGSAAFHDLKNGQDLYDHGGTSHSKAKSKGGSKHKAKGKHKK
jgi:hypothetical protein